MGDNAVEVWAAAARRDATLKVGEDDLPALRRRRIVSEPYTRERLFSQMAKGQAVIFKDFPVRVEGRAGNVSRDTLLSLLRTGFPRSQRARVQAGPSRKRMEIPVPELLRRWAGGRAVVSVTDLHIRDTRMESALGIGNLSDFNLLLLGSPEMAVQEMMTLVISSKGNVTDSHTDDPDGSNHCFLGSKLWLFWETFEGQARGLEDVSRDPVVDRAAFDMATYLSLPSARWLTVSAGETLFLPGKLTHKVVTLEHYMGVGSFYVALPSCLETLSRWYTYGPLWSLDDPKGENAGLVDEIARTVTRKVKSLRRASPRTQEHWGLSHLQAALEAWERGGRSAARERLLAKPPFAELLQVVRESLQARAA